MATQYNNLEQERAYLENLLTTRINFFLLFVSFYFVAIFGVEEGDITQNMRSIAFLFGGIASFLMALYVWRTTLLVEEVLSNLRDEYGDHPYTKAHKKLSSTKIKNISANWYIVILISSFALAFFILAFAS